MSPEDLAAYRANYDLLRWAAALKRNHPTDPRCYVILATCCAIRALCDEVERLRVERDKYREANARARGGRLEERSS